MREGEGGDSWWWGGRTGREQGEKGERGREGHVGDECCERGVEVEGRIHGRARALFAHLNALLVASGLALFSTCCQGRGTPCPEHSCSGPASLTACRAMCLIGGRYACLYVCLTICLSVCVFICGCRCLFFFLQVLKYLDAMVQERGYHRTVVD